MSGRLQNVKGTRDLLPGETRVWAAVEALVRKVFGAYGFDEIRTPVLEDTELFVRGVGAGTDVVGKEMFTFPDRKGRSLTLRPESTAAVARAYLQHGMADWPPPVRLFYMGPQFRYERPQRGRYRQFYQIGAEILGDPGPATDIELLVMLLRFLRGLHFEDLVVRLNTVGDRASRAAFGAALREYLEPYRGELGADSQRRLESNPLRILDTKAPRERELLAEAPQLSEHLTAEARAHFEQLLSGLERFQVPYQVEPRLVRGLDYYTRTVFEIASADLGAQDAILGGGRYDGLIAELGGPEVPGLGFAIGQDRLIEVLPERFRAGCGLVRRSLVIPVGTSTEEALRLAEELREVGQDIIVDTSGRSLRSALRQAVRREVRFVLLLGEDELRDGTVTVRELETSQQTTVAREGLGPFMQGSSE